MTASSEPRLRNWTSFLIALPTGGLPLRSHAARRDHRSYVITSDPTHLQIGFSASHKGARESRSALHFGGDNFASPDEAKAACEADLIRLVWRAD